MKDFACFMFFVSSVIGCSYLWFLVGKCVGRNQFMDELVESGEAEWAIKDNEKVMVIKNTKSESK